MTTNHEALTRLLGAVGDTCPETPEQVNLERLICRAAKRIRRRRRKGLGITARGEPARPNQNNEVTIAAVAQPGDAMRRLWRCYGCGRRSSRNHCFYRRFCPECADFNWEKRRQRGDLRGRRALVTGGRVKIGYQTALKFLRDGAEVLITSRFPRDAAIRYAAEHDHAEWGGRLRILRADFRDIPSLLALIEHLSQTIDSLDILVNNAAQTVQMPPGYYARHEALELASIQCLPGRARAFLVDATRHDFWQPQAFDLAALGRSFALEAEPIPGDLLRQHDEPIDRREHTSWTLSLADVSPRELLEVLLINTAAPFLLTAGLKPLLLRSPASDRYVINVTGLDGRFARRSKSPRHPHVNATKAAVNMMTRTSASDFARDGIVMHSVDAGWISQLGAHRVKARLEALGIRPPLDDVDGAARIYDPILRGMEGDRRFGILWRNFNPTTW